MKTNFRVALVGCGSIAGNHVKAILSAGQELCALCDIAQAHAQQLADKYELGNLRIYTDYVTLLQTEKPDAVHICTPHYLHAPMIIEALKREIHVLCEKPLCISLDQLEVLRKAVAESSAQLGICFQNRYEPNFLHLKELAAKNGVCSGCGYVVWKRDAAYYRSGAWRGTWAEEGGGVMINQAIHTLDLLQWICGMPTHVTAHVFNDCHKGVIEVEDTAAAHFETANGSMLHLFASTASNADFPSQLQLRLSTGEMVFATTDMVMVNQSRQSESNVEEHVGKSVWGNGHKALVADFYKHLASGTPFPIGIEEAEKAIRLILAMYASNGNRMEL